MKQEKPLSQGLLVAVTLVLILIILLAIRAYRLAPPEGPSRIPAGLESADITGSYDPSQTLSSSPELLSLGKQVYEKQCSACHGVDGAGGGPAAFLLYPRPRDFTLARYRLISTWDGIPTDTDLFRTISRGMPGSAMPSWAHLSEKTRWGLVHYVKSLAAEPTAFTPEPQPGAHTGIVQVPPEPPYTEAAPARAAELFAQGCASCHGAKAKGDGVQLQFDEKNLPTRPRDLTLGVFKGSPRPEDIFRRVVAGMPGSPMPSSPHLYGEDGWHIVHFIRSLSSDEQRHRVEMRRFLITAPRAARLPEHPDDGDWRDAPRVKLHLMPLWWRAVRPEELTVQALHNGREVALLLTWEDETHDHTAMRPQDFRDAAALEFSLTPDPPFFAMGAAGEFVNLWMWKSERQADLEPAFQDLEKIYPNIGIDAYPNLSRSALEQPMRHALTLQSDPTFVTGWGAGNIVSDPTRKSPAEDLVSQGFGTLASRPKIDQSIASSGVYSTGSYRVMFRRALAPNGQRSVSFKPGSSVPVAFAVWNGSAGDRDGKKSVTIWQELYLAP
ncbi:MAG: c-type cytochrome [Planctomycetes bacterium]|nr:c-type cytochrome [Planctomycetota bacterium]